MKKELIISNYSCIEEECRRYANSMVNVRNYINI